MTLTSTASQSNIDLAYVRKQMVAKFNLSEVKTICFDLNISYESLPGENTVDDKIRELLDHCSRTGMLSGLLVKLSEEREEVDWYRPQSSVAKRTNDTKAISGPLLEMHSLVKEFNRSRRIISHPERLKVGGDLTLHMRTLSPELGLQFDISAWLHNRNQGKRLAAIAYLGWLQDIEYFDALLDLLFAEKNTFLQYHILLTIYSMCDQVSPFDQEKYVNRIQQYTPEDAPDRIFWKEKILSKLR